MASPAAFPTGTRARAHRLPRGNIPEGWHTARLQAVLVAGLLDAATGDRGQAEERLSLVLAETGQRAEMEYVTEPAAGLARLRLTDGRIHDALSVTDDLINVLAGKGTWRWVADLAPARVAALAAAGRVREAGDLVAAFAYGLRGCDTPAARAGLITRSGSWCRLCLGGCRGAGPKRWPTCSRSRWQVSQRQGHAQHALRS